MPQIFDVTANENARYKRNELELHVTVPLAIAIFWKCTGLRIGTTFSNMTQDIRLTCIEIFECFMCIQLKNQHYSEFE